MPRTCPQSLPQWQALGGAISSKWTDPSLQFNIEDWVEDFYTTDITSKDVNAGPGGVTEDCLFLDVRVPKKALEAASTSQNGAPVLIWVCLLFQSDTLLSPDHYMSKTAHLLCILFNGVDPWWRL